MGLRRWVMFGATDEDTALQSAYRALDAGINFFDSGAFYGKGLAEERLGKVLHGRRHEVQLVGDGICAVAAVSSRCASVRAPHGR